MILGGGKGYNGHLIILAKRRSENPLDLNKYEALHNGSYGSRRGKQLEQQLNLR